MSKTLEALQSGRFRIARPHSLDLPRIHGNDYRTINDSTDRLWEFWRREEAILGTIAGTEDNPWHTAYPGIQYVRNHPDSVHMVIAPERDTRVAPEDLSINDSAKAVAFVQQFLRSRDKHTFAGYNIGPEPNGSQMWWTWHIHLVQFNKGELIEHDKRPRILWEPWPAQIEEIMGDIFVNRLLAGHQVPQAEKMDLAVLERFGFSSVGSTLLRFSPDISAHELATVLRQADIVYKSLHRDLKTIYYQQQYEEMPHTKRENQIIETRLKAYGKQHALHDQTIEYLLNFGTDVLPNDLTGESSANSPLRLPNYSVVLLRDDQGLYVLFQPHIFRKKASALSSLGVFLDYTLDTDPQRVQDYTEKKARYQQLVSEINSAIQSNSSEV